MLWVLNLGNNYVHTGMDLPDCILDMERETERYESQRAELEDQHSGLTIKFTTERTRDQMDHDIQELIESVAPGDEWEFNYSGHGSNKWKQSSEEGDHKDEALVGIDGRLLMDDRFCQIIARARGKGRIRLDSCFGGGMLDEAALRRDRFYGNVRIPRFWPMEDSVPPQLFDVVPTYGRIAPTTQFGVLMHSACLEKQVSYSTGDGGAFSLARHQVWQPGMTWRQMQHAIVPHILPSGEFPQHPKLYGPSSMRDKVELV